MAGVKCSGLRVEFSVVAESCSGRAGISSVGRAGDSGGTADHSAEKFIASVGGRELSALVTDASGIENEYSVGRANTSVYPADLSEQAFMASVCQFTASGICKYVADKEDSVLAIASLRSDTTAIRAEEYHRHTMDSFASYGFESNNISLGIDSKD